MFFGFSEVAIYQMMLIPYFFTGMLWGWQIGKSNAEQNQQKAFREAETIKIKSSFHGW